MSASAAAGAAYLDDTIARMNEIEARKKLLAPNVRQAFLSLEPLIKDPAAEMYLMAPESVTHWRVLRDQDPDAFLVYIAHVRQRFGSITARLITDRIGMPGTGAGGRDALPYFTASGVWGEYTASGYIAKRIVEPKAITSLFGDQGTYKSALAVALACSVATGRRFHGINTRKAAVLIIAGEGVGGMRKRLRAWMLAHDIGATDPEPPIAVTEAPANLIGGAEQLKATVAAAEEQLGLTIEMLVLDTLAANFGNGEENSASDMALAIANTRLAAPSAGLVVVHHSGHGSDRERGSSSLPFGSDFRFRTSYDKASHTVELRNLKQKDDELQPSMFFAPRRFPVGWKDADGEELSAVVLDRISEPETIAEPAPRRTGASGLGANQETVLKVLKRLYREYRANLQQRQRDPADAMATVGGLRQATVGKGLMVRQRFQEAIDALKERGLVAIDGPHITLVEPEK